MNTAWLTPPHPTPTPPPYEIAVPQTKEWWAAAVINPLCEGVCAASTLRSVLKFSHLLTCTKTWHVQSTTEVDWLWPQRSFFFPARFQADAKCQKRHSSRCLRWKKKKKKIKKTCPLSLVKPMFYSYKGFFFGLRRNSWNTTVTRYSMSSNLRVGSLLIHSD